MGENRKGFVSLLHIITRGLYAEIIYVCATAKGVNERIKKTTICCYTIPSIWSRPSKNRSRSEDAQVVIFDDELRKSSPRFMRWRHGTKFQFVPADGRIKSSSRKKNTPIMQTKKRKSYSSHPNRINSDRTELERWIPTARHHVNFRHRKLKEESFHAKRKDHAAVTYPPTPLYSEYRTPWLCLVRGWNRWSRTRFGRGTWTRSRAAAVFCISAFLVVVFLVIYPVIILVER